jgi:hypothetical protein
MIFCKGEDLMFAKIEEVRMWREEMEAYGRKIDARNIEYEHVEVLEENTCLGR